MRDLQPILSRGGKPCARHCVLSFVRRKKYIYACILICIEYLWKNTLETVIVDASREHWVTGWKEGRRLLCMSSECYAYVVVCHMSKWIVGEGLRESGHML